MSDKIYGQFDLNTIEQLAKLVKENKLEELTLTSGENTLTIKGRSCPPPPPMGGMPPMAPMAMPAMPQAEAPAPAQAEAPAKEEGTVVKAPIVGTFYASPSPDKAPFVQEGDTVNKGDVIMIIESMKLMNEVTSEVSGTVKKILVKNGEAVEYDQPIMIIG